MKGGCMVARRHTFASLLIPASFNSEQEQLDRYLCVLSVAWVQDPINNIIVFLWHRKCVFKKSFQTASKAPRALFKDRKHTFTCLILLLFTWLFKVVYILETCFEYTFRGV
jgi:hypothetical protein